jgi:hypothetical protein
MPNLNEMFDAVFYVNLDRRTDRRVAVEAQFAAHGIKAERFPGFDDRENPERGCFMSHQGVYRIAKSRDCGSVMVFEDDIALPADFPKRLDCFSDVPDDWRCVLFGGNRITPKGCEQVRPEHVRGRCWRLTYEFVMFAYVLRGVAIDLMMDEFFGLSIDNYLILRMSSGGGWYGLMDEDEAGRDGIWGMVGHPDIRDSDLKDFRFNRIFRGWDRNIDGDRAYHAGDQKKAFQLWMEGALFCNRECMRNVAYAYEIGIGVEKNSERAKWWKERCQ